MLALTKNGSGGSAYYTVLLTDERLPLAISPTAAIYKDVWDESLAEKYGAITVNETNRGKCHLSFERVLTPAARFEYLTQLEDVILQFPLFASGATSSGLRGFSEFSIHLLDRSDQVFQDAEPIYREIANLCSNYFGAAWHEMKSSLQRGVYVSIVVQKGNATPKQRYEFTHRVRSLWISKYIEATDG